MKSEFSVLEYRDCQTRWIIVHAKFVLGNFESWPPDFLVLSWHRHRFRAIDFQLDLLLHFSLQVPPKDFEEEFVRQFFSHPHMQTPLKLSTLILDWNDVGVQSQLANIFIILVLEHEMPSLIFEDVKKQNCSNFGKDHMVDVQHERKVLGFCISNRLLSK